MSPELSPRQTTSSAQPGSGSLAALLDSLPQQGKVTWIGVRPARRAPMQVLERVTLVCGQGLHGDRFRSRRTIREVTLIQAEHLDALAGLTGQEQIDPAQLRRNLVVSGINLLALRDRQFAVGSCRLLGTGLAHPCSRMEAVLGPGGYNAMRGHGGITAQIVTPGEIRLADTVRLITPPP